MKAIITKNPHDTCSFSRRYFLWKNKSEDDKEERNEEILTFNSSSLPNQDDDVKINESNPPIVSQQVNQEKKKFPVFGVSKLRSALTFGKNRARFSGLGTKVIGTLFGNRRGHVHFAFQDNPNSCPAFLVELATPTSVLVREMASGQVRIALECDKNKAEKKGLKLIDEYLWRTYCNGRKCGYAIKRECGVDEWKVLNSIGPVTMGAGVLPGSGSCAGEVMYMRAKFERVVGSKDSEAYYMMNPDGRGGPELSVYLLRV